MPIYEYECEKCHRRVEFIQKFSDSRKTRCPKCGGKLKRLISAPGLQFKGSGWYITDYARGGSRGGGGAGAPDSNGGSSPASEDAKPEEVKKPAAAEPARPKRRSSRRSTLARRRRR